jgi:hypothetical protein
MNKSLLIDIAFLILICSLIFILKIPVINLPYTEDGATYTMNSALWIYDHHIVYPIIEDLRRGVSGGCGHPTFLFNLLALLYHIFGYSIQLTHIVMIIMGCITLIYTYLLASHIYNRHTAVIATLLLLVSPLFFSVFGQVRLDVPLTTFGVISAYYAVKEKRWLFAFTGSLLVLSKEPGTVIVMISILYIALKYFKKESITAYISRLLSYSIPGFVFICWMIVFRSFSGNYVWKHFVFMIVIPTHRMQQVFIWNFQWFLSLIIIISLIKYGFKNGFYPRRLKYCFIASIIFFIIFSFGESPNNDIGIFSNIIFSILSGCIITIDYRKIEIKNIFIPMLLIIYILLHGFIFELLPRYMLLMIPLFLTVASAAINNISGKSKYLLVILTIIPAIAFAYHINHSPYIWTNMSYKELIDLRFEMLNYIGDRYIDKKVITDSYLVPIMLQEPRLGYVTKEMIFKDVQYLQPLPPNQKPDYDIILSIVEPENGILPMTNTKDAIPILQNYFQPLKEFPGKIFLGRIWVPKTSN